MHEVKADEGESVPGLRNVEVRLRRGAVRPRDEYFELLDALAARDAGSRLDSFTSTCGLGRAALTGGALGAWQTLHLVWAAWAASRLARGGLEREEREAALLGLAWSLFMVLLCVYHWSEFLVTMRFNAPVGACESFLLDQSRQYQVAMGVSMAEFWLEAWLAPGLKTALPCRALMLLGFALCVMGQVFRSGAMWQAGSNFTHVIQTEKVKGHRLVTSGLYSVVRHPSYFGWFWWSVGTQLLVCNPVSCLGFAAAGYAFFKGRIPVEERLLEQFFPDEFPAFRQRTPTGIPFLK